MVEATGAVRGGRGARDRIAAAAATLFSRHGIHATGVEALTSAASVSKRTFYQHFPSKDELVRSYLRSLDEGGGTALERQLDDIELTPRERLLAIFDARPVDRFRGCPFHNAAVESAGVVEGVDEIVRDHKLRFAQRLSDVAAEAGAADPRQLGNQLLVLFEGATALATSLNDTAPLVHARAAAAYLVDAAGAHDSAN
jgi:AcrR family transcriptional regulator